MRVILAVDGSECSQLAIRDVGQRPWPPETEIWVVTVDAPFGVSMLGEPSLAISAYDDLVARQRAEASECMERSAERLQRMAPTLKVSTALLEGSPKAELIEFAKRCNADLIVVGSHGRGAVSSILLGSVSLALAMGAPCSVLIVRASAQ